MAAKTLLLPQITFESISFQTFSEFSSQWSSEKYCFEFLIFHDLFPFSLTWDPMGEKNVKTLLLPQITFESISFQTFSEFSTQWSSQKYSFEFVKF